MESLGVFTDPYEGVLRACEQLETYYKMMNNLGNLSAVSNKLEEIDENSAEVEEIVKGYLSRTEKLSKRDEELCRIEQVISIFNGRGCFFVVLRLLHFILHVQFHLHHLCLVWWISTFRLSSQLQFYLLFWLETL